MAPTSFSPWRSGIFSLPPWSTFCAARSRAPTLTPPPAITIRRWRCTPDQDRPDATIAIGGGVTGIGTGGASPEPESQIQNRFSEGDDIVWTKGAHTLRFGGSVDRVQSDVYWPFRRQVRVVFRQPANVPGGNCQH